MFDLTRLFMIVARVIVLLTAMPIHESAHGFAAHKLGDDTAKNQGRLTLNPLKHLDLVGSLLLVFAGFGWAKPVMVDARNFKHPKRDMAITSLAGPLSNILFATVIMAIYKVFASFLPVMRSSNIAYAIAVLLSVMIEINLYLAVFNLIPIPPLDGSKIIGALLPDRWYFTVMRYERYVMVLLIILIFSGKLSEPLSFLTTLIYRLINFLTTPFGRIF